MTGRRLGVLMLEISLEPLEKLGGESVPGGERFDVEIPAFSLDSPHQPKHFH